MDGKNVLFAHVFHDAQDCPELSPIIVILSPPLSMLIHGSWYSPIVLIPLLLNSYASMLTG